MQQQVKARDGSIRTLREGEILLDGESLYTPMSFMDSASGFDPNNHQPHFVAMTDAQLDAKEKQIQDHKKRLSDMWRTPVTPPHTVPVDGQLPLHQKPDDVPSYASYDAKISNAWR
jgi:hypothetical protein